MKMNEPFDKINIITSTDTQKWTGEFKIYFVQQAQEPQQQQSKQLQMTMPIKKIAILQENYVYGKKVTASIPPSSNVSLTDPTTWATILTPNENTTTTLSINPSSTPLVNQHKNQTSISTSSTEQQQPLSPKTNTTSSNTTTASNNTSNVSIPKTTSNTGSIGTPTISTSNPGNAVHAPPPESQNLLLNTTVMTALITTIGGVIGTITAAIIANKNKNKSS